MKILLDTNIVIWLLESNDRLKSYHRETIKNNSGSVYFSLLNIYEIAMAQGVGRLKNLPKPSKVSHFLKLSNLYDLPLNIYAFDEYHALPMHHKDPFDRLLIAQAIHENCTIMTSDSQFQHYDIDVITV